MRQIDEVGQRREALLLPKKLHHTTDGEDQLRFCQNLDCFMKRDFLKSSYMKSRGVKYHSYSLLIPCEVAIRVLVYFQDY